MTFTPQQRQRLSALADVLIPANQCHLSANQADVGSRGLDQVLETCPEMAPALFNLLNRVGQQSPEDAIVDLRQNDPASFGLLCEFAAGAYFLNPAVRESIAYAGQTPRPIDLMPDYLRDGLLESVIRRGPIYRPTPVASPQL